MTIIIPGGSSFAIFPKLLQGLAWLRDWWLLLLCPGGLMCWRLCLHGVIGSDLSLFFFLFSGLASANLQRFITEYLVQGDIFIYNDIVLFLHRALFYPPEDNNDSPQSLRRLPPIKEMIPLEKSGSYVLQAAIRVQDGNNQETMKAASQQLLALREQLRTAVRLEQADRLALDPRAK